MRFKYRPLSEFADVKGGKRLPKGKNLTCLPTLHPYIRVRDLGANKFLELTSSYQYIDDETQATISRYTVNAGDIIISIVGTIGLVAQVGPSLDGANLTENCAKIVNVCGLNKDYLYYYLLSREGQKAINSATVGAVQAKLPLKNIQAILIPDIPIDEQNFIADTLASLDARIAVNERINHCLGKMAREIFKSWFVNFAPFQEEEFIESELGYIPKGWDVVPLSELCSLISRGITPNYIESGGQVVINQKCIRDHQVNLGPSRFHVPKTLNERWLQYGDVLVNSTGQGTLGRVAQWLETATNVTVDSHVTIVRPSEKCYIHYIGQFLMGKEREIEGMAAGSTGQTELSRDRLGSLLLVRPKIGQLEKFSEIVEPLMTKIVVNNHESEKLAKIRDMLFPKLLNGELPISNKGSVTIERSGDDDRTR